MCSAQFHGMNGLFADYDPGGFWCEFFGRPATPTGHAHAIAERLTQIKGSDLARRARAAERELLNLGITFTVYTDRTQIDRILPFDVIPRIISAADWAIIEAGVRQRVLALNLFLADIYGQGAIFRDGVIPRELVEGNSNFQEAMRGLKVAHGAYVNICGTDIIRDEAGIFRVLEDNARTPSGVSYVVENRHLTRRAFPDLINRVPVRNVSDYGQNLLEALAELAPEAILDPQVVLLSPGTYNSAYFEHIFLAREMGVPLVEGRDLVIENDRVFMKTVAGLEPVDVIYRRIDDGFLDPLAFRPDSALGVPGLFECYRKGTVGLANAIGTGVADDKAVYAYMPRIIRYYLSEDPILLNVETHICREPEGLQITLDKLQDLVVKPVGESGGYGIVIGPRASAGELAETRARIEANPANYISQPMIDLSVAPTLIDGRVEPRHVDMRPFAVTGRSTWVLPGGLTRVALRRGSLIVNSSQGGGSKDTWVLE